ncbi:hypothetical protein FHR59_001689 [Xanthomonas arboricola]|uniref:hypothetical protein n=1 Tax=Xanthomonas arboricola TaxID=56448 RepID=UPI001611C287|nr:hypothetical protein [Xanthomonas arboricola]MBB6337479.1 hypothetical protein [Xanthomonas arboricola]
MRANDIRKKKADLWEKTIVTAFRDMQWAHRPRQNFYPPSNIDLDGNIERAFGDSVALLNDKLFLFEMKSTKEKIKDEWRDGKLAFRSLRRKVAKTAAGESEGNKNFLHLSMRIHHFLYWSEDASNFGPDLWPGALSFSPYLMGVADKLQIGPMQLTDLIGESTLAVPDGHEALKAVNSAFVSRLFDDRVSLVSKREIGKNSCLVSYGLGASPKEISLYLHWLLEEQSEADLPINVLLANNAGTVCRHVSHISELILLLDTMMSSSPTEGVVARVNLEVKNDDWSKINPVKEEEFLAMLVQQPAPRSGPKP